MTRIGLTLDEHLDPRMKPRAGADPACRDTATDKRCVCSHTQRPERKAGHRPHMVMWACGPTPVPAEQTNGAGGNRTPKHLRNLRENTPIPTGAQRQAQRGPHRGRNGAQYGGRQTAHPVDQFRPRRGRTPGAATPRPTPTWPASWRRGPTCRPKCGPGSSRRSAPSRLPADPARRPTEPTKPAMPRRGGPSPPVPSAATSAWFLPAGLADVTPAGTAASID